MDIFYKLKETNIVHSYYSPMIPSPFRWISAKARPRTLTVLLAATLCLSLAMSILGAPLKTPLSPRGIIDLELAGSAQLVGEYLAEWDLTTRLYLAAGLGFDYLYLVVYGLFFGLACHQMAEWNKHVGFFNDWARGSHGDAFWPPCSMRSKITP